MRFPPTLEYNRHGTHYITPDMHLIFQYFQQDFHRDQQTFHNYRIQRMQRVLTSLRLLSSSFRHECVVHCCVRFTGSNIEIKLSLLAVSET